MLLLQGNLSWSSTNILNIGCVTEFVMMFRDGDNITSSATVLCPSYEIFSSETSFWCEYSLDEAFCGTRLYLMLGGDCSNLFEMGKILSVVFRKLE